jgi:hypothetical protein
MEAQPGPLEAGPQPTAGVEACKRRRRPDFIDDSIAVVIGIAVALGETVTDR